ncbi:MAG: XTP/dITP diphosphatase [Clostridia bacterium]|nr:XTP/dITP diphosphatase [Clostridia bacterium]
MQTYILASKNQHKAEEISQILGEGYTIITQTQAGVGDIDVVEDGATFEENAAKKAETIMQATGKPCIADDSGLCVDYLGGAPGIYTARYAGENATDGENIEKLLTALDGVPTEQRSAQFVCVIALAEPGKETRLFRGECHGKILTEKRGKSGFGYDPVFYIEDLKQSLAELPAEGKNAISHRFAALNKLAKETRE